MVFAEPSNRSLLIKLIEIFIPGKKIKTLTYDDKEQHGLILSDKTSILDLYCTTDTGERLIIEMQFSTQQSFRDRMLYYSTYPIRPQVMERMKLLSTEDESSLRKKNFARDEGHAEAIHDTAVRMIQSGCENDFICRMTGLASGEVEALRAE